MRSAGAVQTKGIGFFVGGIEFDRRFHGIAMAWSWRIYKPGHQAGIHDVFILW